MRIAIVTGEYPPMEGGVGAFTHELALALGDLGHEVHILTREPADGSSASPPDPTLSVERIIPSWDWRGLVTVQRQLHRLAPDIVNLQYEAAAYDLKGWITALPWTARRSPIAVTFHDLLPPYLFPKAGPLRQRCVWRLARLADGVIATNREDLKVLQTIIHDGIPPLRLIPIGSNISPVQLPEYKRDTWRARYGFHPEDLVIGFFGFLNRTKGVDTLIHSLARLVTTGHSVKLLFIGGRTGTSDTSNTAYADEIEALITDLQLTAHVQHTGFAAAAEVSAALYSVDICVLPFTEGANLRHGTLHAALSHGCAIVTTRPSHPVPELKDGRNVLLVPPEDPEALAEAIVRLGFDTTLRQRLSRGATKLAQRFTWPHIAYETAEFFTQLIQSPVVK